MTFISVSDVRDIKSTSSLNGDKWLDMISLRQLTSTQFP